MKHAKLITAISCLIAIHSTPARGQSADRTNAVQSVSKASIAVAEEKRILQQHDANANGRIDASEHRGYSRAIAKQRRIERAVKIDQMKSDPALREAHRQQLNELQKKATSLKQNSPVSGNASRRGISPVTIEIAPSKDKP